MPVRRTLLAGIVAGLLAGLFVTGLQAARVAPLILAAEVYEDAAAAHVHDHASSGAAAPAEWEPAPGLERTAFTLLANLVVGAGCGLLLAAGIAWRHAATGALPRARTGVLWGLAGFACFSLAPALGLTPQPPGTLVAELASRQLWWLCTVAGTAAGIGLLAFGRNWVLKGLGATLILLPHLVGAPQPPPGVNAVPPELAREFALASLATAAMFWLFLGSVEGWLYVRLGRDGRA